MSKSSSPWPCFTEEEAEAVRRVLLSNKVNYWTGEECRRFEKEFADFANAKFAIAVANGTVALDLILYGLGIGVGDEVIVTPRTYLASVSCIVTAGAKPVFADVDEDSQLITAQSIEEVITEATKAVLCVHLAGWPCDMDKIRNLANRYGLRVVEDCAQAHGAGYQGKSVGSLGDAGAWSFCQDKIMTTGGEGGMVTTDDEDLWGRMWAYKDHGKSYDAVYHREHPPGFRWLHESFGTNWRLTEMQAAIGRIQLRRMPKWHQQRVENAGRLREACAQFDSLRVSWPEPNIRHAFYRLYAFVELDHLSAGWDRDRLVRALQDRGVPCMQGTCSEVYLEKAFEGTGLRPARRLPVAQRLGETSIAFLVHPTLKAKEIDQFCRSIADVMEQASI